MKSMTQTQTGSAFNSNSNFARSSKPSSRKDQKKSFLGFDSHSKNHSGILGGSDDVDTTFNSSQATLVETSCDEEDEEQEIDPTIAETIHAPETSLGEPRELEKSYHISISKPTYSEPISRDARKDLILKLLPETSSRVRHKLKDLEFPTNKRVSEDPIDIGLVTGNGSISKRIKENCPSRQSQDDSQIFKRVKTLNDSARKSQTSVYVSIPSVLSSKATIPSLMTPREAFLYLKVKSAMHAPVTNPAILYTIDSTMSQLLDQNIIAKFKFTTSQLIQFLSVYSSSIGIAANDQDDGETLILKANFLKKDKVRLFLTSQKQQMSLYLNTVENRETLKENLNKIEKTEGYVKLTLIEDNTLIQLERIISLNSFGLL